MSSYFLDGGVEILEQPVSVPPPPAGTMPWAIYTVPEGFVAKISLLSYHVHFALPAAAARVFIIEILDPNKVVFARFMPVFSTYGGFAGAPADMFEMHMTDYALDLAVQGGAGNGFEWESSPMPPIQFLSGYTLQFNMVNWQAGDAITELNLIVELRRSYGRSQDRETQALAENALAYYLHTPE